MRYRYHLGVSLVLFFALLAGIACTDEDASPDALPTNTPIPTQTPTPEIAGKFSAEPMPLPGKEWISRFSHMLSVVPADHGPILFLDMKELRYKPKVEQAITSQMAPALAAIPSAVTNVIKGAVLANNSEDGSALVVLRTPLDIATMLYAASSLKIASNIPEPEAYQSHQIWSFEDNGDSLAIGSVDQTTSAASAGSPGAGVSPIVRVKNALDTFDGSTPNLLDLETVSLVVNNLPQGLVVAVFNGCQALAAVAGLQDCVAAGVSAELLDLDTVAINVVAVFQEDGHARVALEVLNTQGIRLGESAPQDSAVRQEGSLVRARLIIKFDQLASVFDAFGLTPSVAAPILKSQG